MESHLAEKMSDTSKKQDVKGSAVTKSVKNDVFGLDARRQGAAGSSPCGNSNECPKIRIGTLNVCTMNDKSDVLTETFSKLGLCCVQQ